MFKNLTNPNGCQAQGTFFLLHDYMNYHDVMSLREDGHEMAVSSIREVEVGTETGCYELTFQ